MSGARVPPWTSSPSAACTSTSTTPTAAATGCPPTPGTAPRTACDTRRQLRASGLRPAGQPVTAQIIWRHRGRRRIAYLYRTDQAAPKRLPLPRSSPPSPPRCAPAAPARPAALRSPTTSRSPWANAWTAPPKEAASHAPTQPQRRNPRLDTDQLAAELDQLAADLCPGLFAGRGKSTVLIRYLARTVTPGTLLAVTGGTQPIPQLAAGSR